MKRLLKVELSRALISKAMMLSIVIGLAIIVSHIFQNVIPWAMSIEEYMAYNKPMFSPANTFKLWIGENQAMQGYLYYMILPILAVIPFGDSFFTDRKGGYIKNVLIRASTFLVMGVKEDVY